MSYGRALDYIYRVGGIRERQVRASDTVTARIGSPARTRGRAGAAASPLGMGRAGRALRDL